MDANRSPYRSGSRFAEEIAYEGSTGRPAYPSDGSRASGRSETNYSGSKRADTSSEFPRNFDSLPSSSRRYNYEYSERLVDDGGDRLGYGNGHAKNYDVSWSDEDIIHDYPGNGLHRESATTSRAGNLRNGGKESRENMKNRRGGKSNSNWQTVTEEEFEREYFGMPDKARRENHRIEESRNIRKDSRYEPMENTNLAGSSNNTVQRTVYTKTSSQSGAGTPKSGKESKTRFADLENRSSSSTTNKTTEKIRYHRPTRKKGFEKRTAEFFENKYQDIFDTFGCGGGRRKSKSMQNLTASDITVYSAQPTSDHLEKSESSYTTKTQGSYGDTLRSDRAFKDMENHRRQGYRSIDSTGTSRSRCNCQAGRPCVCGRRLYKSQSERNLNTATYGRSAKCCCSAKCCSSAKCCCRSQSRDTFHTVRSKPVCCRCTIHRTGFSTPVSPAARLRQAQSRSVSYDTGLDREDPGRRLYKNHCGSCCSLVKMKSRETGSKIKSDLKQERGIQTDIRKDVQIQTEVPEDRAITTQFSDKEPDVTMYRDQVLNFYILGREEEEQREEPVRKASAAVQTIRPPERIPERAYREEYIHQRPTQTPQEETKVTYSRPMAVRKEIPVAKQPPPVKKPKPFLPSEAYVTNLFMKPRISESRSYEMESNTPTPGVREEITVPVLSSEYIPVERPRPTRDVQIVRAPESQLPPPVPEEEEEEEEVILETSSIEEKEQRIRMQIREDVEFSMLRTQGGSQVPPIDAPDGYKRSVEPWWIPEKFEAVVDRRKQKSTQIEQTESDGDFHLRREQEVLSSNPSDGYEINSAARQNAAGRNLERSGWKSNGNLPASSRSQFNYSNRPLNFRQLEHQDDRTNEDDSIVVEQALAGKRIPLKMHQETSRERVTNKSYSGPEVVSEAEVGLKPVLTEGRVYPIDVGEEEYFGDLPEQFFSYGLDEDQLQYRPARSGRRNARADYDTLATAL